MFLDLRDSLPPPRWEPPRRSARPPAPKLTRRDEAVIGWVVAGAVILVLAAPVGGASIVEAVLQLVG